mmetsp:Transcript_148182/g.259004  ORF Transcript_148182/g.259004 Transcript_148182/m.259004 type:complete len:251 (-) Transcript_148182:775-1527(-)
MQPHEAGAKARVKAGGEADSQAIHTAAGSAQILIPIRQHHQGQDDLCGGLRPRGSAVPHRAPHGPHVPELVRAHRTAGLRRLPSPVFRWAPRDPPPLHLHLEAGDHGHAVRRGRWTEDGAGPGAGDAWAPQRHHREGGGHLHGRAPGAGTAVGRGGAGARQVSAPFPFDPEQADRGKEVQGTGGRRAAEIGTERGERGVQAAEAQGTHVHTLVPIVGGLHAAACTTRYGYPAEYRSLTQTPTRTLSLTRV